MVLFSDSVLYQPETWESENTEFNLAAAVVVIILIMMMIMIGIIN